MNFEAHITVEKMQLQAARAVIGDFDQDWVQHYSAIDGDPVLGKGVKGYVTFHGMDLEKVLARLNTLVKKLEDNGVIVLRKKIEVVVLDERFTQ